MVVIGKFKSTMDVAAFSFSAKRICSKATNVYATFMAMSLEPLITLTVQSRVMLDAPKLSLHQRIMWEARRKCLFSRYDTSRNLVKYHLYQYVLSD